jgi:hypothetical protein
LQKCLPARSSDRRHQPAADGKLFDQRVHQSRSRRGHHDGVVGSMLRPTDAAIVVFAAHIHAQLAETLARLPQQIADTLHRVDLQPQRGEDRGLVAGTGPHFQHGLRLDRQHRLGHPRHHPWLGNGLPVSDRQGRVFVRPRRQCLIDEQMAWHHPHRIERWLAGNPSLPQAIHQAVAHALRSHANAHRFWLQPQARRHSFDPSVADSPPTQLATFSNAE